MLFYLWEFGINTIETILFYILVNQKLERKKDSCSFLLITAMLGIIGIEFCMNFFHCSTVVTVLACLFLHYIFAVIFYSSPNHSKLFWSILYTVMGIVTDSLVMLIPTRVFHIDVEVVLTHGNMRVLFTFIYMIMLSFLVVATLSFGSKTFRLGRMERIAFTFIAFVCVVIEQIVLISLIYTSEYSSHDDYNTRIFIFFLVLLLFFAMIFYVYRLGIEKEKNLELARTNIISKLENDQYEQALSTVAELRILKHDIKNHLSALQILLQRGNYTEAACYMEEMTGNLDKLHHTISSGNATMDCILTSKLAKANAHHIDTKHTVHLPSNIPFTDVELCSLIGNLYDNAIESCERIPEEDNRYIELHIKPFNNMVSILIQNSSDGTYKKDPSGQLTSRKSIKAFNSEHGIGLKRIQEITEKYNGYIEISPNENDFCVSILIPLTTNNELQGV